MLLVGRDEERRHAADGWQKLQLGREIEQDGIAGDDFTSASLRVYAKDPQVKGVRHVHARVARVEAVDGETVERLNRAGPSGRDGADVPGSLGGAAQRILQRLNRHAVETTVTR